MTTFEVERTVCYVYRETVRVEADSTANATRRAMQHKDVTVQNEEFIEKGRVLGISRAVPVGTGPGTI